FLTTGRPSTDNVQHIESTVERDRMKNFRRHQLEDDTDMRTMIRTSRPYVHSEFNQPEYSRNESNNSCEAVPAANMIRYKDQFYLIPLYVDRNVTLTDTMIDQAKQLAWVLAGLSTCVFKMPVETMHLFRDIDSARIAFNSNGALFFNLRYFEQMSTLCQLLFLVVLATAFARSVNVYPSTYCIRFDTNVKNAIKPIIINITQSWAPLGANHLFDVINSQFYAVPAAFFRVVPGFVVQFGISGDPQQNKIWNGTIVDDPVLMSNTVGTLSYATAGPDTRTTQLFINYVNNTRLDLLGFAPLGIVTTGLDTANAIFNPTPGRIFVSSAILPNHIAE
ncbi:unnamed protein product, partial [Didymodactylos carnosus]